MKKLLSLLLSVVMALSLTVPAFADTPTVLPMPKDALPPIISVDEALGIIGGADGPTAIFTTVDLEGLDLDSTLEELLQQLSVDLKESLGGVAGQIGVMVNGQYVRFPDAVPEIANGNTMVPLRALVEALGGKVEADGGKVVCTIGLTSITFEYPDVQVEYRNPDGSGESKTEFVTMPSRTYYVKGGRTYVPVRFIAGILGYEVGWDSAYQTAILLDREKLAADIDGNFSILNRVQAAANAALKDGESWSADMKGGLSLTTFDTVNGNQTYKADLNCKVLLNSEAFDGTCSVAISDNAIDTLAKLVGTDEDAETLRTVLTGLKDMRVIMTREGMAWVHAPALDELGEQENVWFAADFGAELGALMFSELGTSATIGSTLVSMAGGNSVAEMAAVCQLAGFMEQLYGDGKFTTSGGTSTLTIGVDELMGLYEEMGIDLGEIEDEVKDIFKEYNITMKVDSKGAATVTAVMEIKAQQGIPTIKITADSASDGRKSAVNMKLHVANLFQLELTLTADQKTTSQAPKTEPPKGANIVAPAMR